MYKRSFERLRHTDEEQPGGEWNQPARSKNVHAAYFNLVLKTSYSPDLNGNHFGFDFGNVRFINNQAKTIDRSLRYSAQSKNLWITLSEQGAPQDQLEHIDQSQKAHLQEVAKELRQLGAGSPQAPSTFGLGRNGILVKPAIVF